MKQKEAMEEEMEGHFGLLGMHGVTLSTPLVDSEGFPRADIDVHAIRIARTALIRLRNDHRQLMEELGKVLEEIYKVGGELPDSGRGSKGGDHKSGSGKSEREGRKRALARVNLIAGGSPAEKAVSVDLQRCSYQTIQSVVNNFAMRLYITSLGLLSFSSNRFIRGSAKMTRS